MRIALDIGHATGTGAVGNGLEEHDVAVSIVKHLEPLLKNHGHSVEVIDFAGKSNEEDLRLTIGAINRGAFDISVSIHCDSYGDPNSKGAHVCYVSNGGKKLAEAISSPLTELMPGRSKKIDLRKNLGVLNQTKPIAVLIECGFLTNESDAKMLREQPELIAVSIARGIENFTNN